MLNTILPWLAWLRYQRFLINFSDTQMFELTQSDGLITWRTNTSRFLSSTLSRSDPQARDTRFMMKPFCAFEAISRRLNDGDNYPTCCERVWRASHSERSHLLPFPYVIHFLPVSLFFSFLFLLLRNLRKPSFHSTPLAISFHCQI